MPFGLCNVSATFQRLMERVLGSKIGTKVLVYLNDVLVYSGTPVELLKSLKQVLQLLAGAGLIC